MRPGCKAKAEVLMQERILSYVALDYDGGFVQKTTLLPIINQILRTVARTEISVCSKPSRISYATEKGSKFGNPVVNCR